MRRGAGSLLSTILIHCRDAQMKIFGGDVGHRRRAFKGCSCSNPLALEPLVKE